MNTTSSRFSRATRWALKSGIAATVATFLFGVVYLMYMREKYADVDDMAGLGAQVFFFGSPFVGLFVAILSVIVCAITDAIRSKRSL